MPTNIHFLPTVQFNPKEVRDIFLHQAEAKSHAARVSYLRNKGQKTRVKSNSGGTGTLRHVKRNASFSQEYPSGSEIASNSQVPPANILHCIQSGGLDPFLTVADDLPRSDRKQLQSYLVTHTRAIVPERQRPSFCAVRDVLLPKLAVSATMVQCLMLIVELSIDASRLLIYSRRRSLMKMLRNLTKTEETYMQRSTAVTLATMIVAEYRAGDINAAQCHAMGLQGWVRFYGGYDAIETLDFFTGISLLSTFVYFDFNIFHAQKELDVALERMELPSGYMVPSLSQYFSPADMGSQLAVLYVMNTVLQQNIPGFVDRLEDRISGNIEIEAGAMLYMMGESIMKLGQWQAFRSGRIIEFVRLLSFARTETRIAVGNALAGNLNGIKSEPIDLDSVKREIRLSWIGRKSNSRMFPEADWWTTSGAAACPLEQSFWSRDGRISDNHRSAKGFSHQPRALRCPMRCS